MDRVAAVLIAGLALARSSETGQRIIRVQIAENIYIYPVGTAVAIAAKAMVATTASLENILFR